MRPNGNPAFTLPELLCALAIIAILAALALGVLPKALGRAQRLRHQSAEGQTNILKMIDASDTR